MTIYSDLRIKDDDLAVDDADQAEIITDRDCIIQDLINAIRETGYLVTMVAERNPDKRKLLLQAIVLLVEADERIVPGSVTITENAPAGFGKPWSWDLIAETYEFNSIKLNLGVN